MLMDGRVDIKDIRRFLFELKTKALAIEANSTGLVKQTMFARLQILDALLIFFNTQMEAQDMDKLDLTMGTKPLPTKQVKAEEEKQAELARELARIAGTVPVGHMQPLHLGDLNVRSVSSKMWALRAEGRLPKDIKPSIRKGKLFMQHMTPEELEDMRKSKKEQESSN